MSLFGGDGSAPASESPYETETELSQLSSTRSAPLLEEHPSPLNAQHPANSYHAIAFDDDGNTLAVGESDSSSSEGEEEELPARPNRFKGGQATWRGYTEADRQIAASLEQMTNSDLAAHLYNAHALKLRVRRTTEELAGLKSWQSGGYWLKRGSELEYTDVSGEVQTNLVPAKDWTAWPLPLAKLPRSHGQTGQEVVRSGRGAWSIGDAGARDVRGDMSDELLAMFLRLAKERWSTRETADEPIRRETRTTQSRSRSRSKSARSARSQRSQRSASKADVDMKDANDDDSQTDNAKAQNEDEEKFGNIITKKRGRVAQPEIFLKSVFLADDERALKTLQPTINSILSKVDSLALTIRRTRLNHFGHGAYSDKSSQSEFTSGAESNKPTSRLSSGGRAKSRASSKRSVQPTSRATSVQSRRSSMQADFSGRSSFPDSDTDSDSNTDNIKLSAQSRKRGRPRSTTDEQSASGTRNDAWRAGLMDWSEVIGLAAIKGWDERVIARTAQRCAALFGESMSLTMFDESLATKPTTEPVKYTPSTIPAPSIISAEHSSPMRPLFRSGTLRCPHIDCYGHKKDFKTPYRVVQHCIRVHDYDPRTNDSDNEDRTVGGVHIDGFLQPIAAQRGWLERGKSRAGGERKKQRLEQDDSTGAKDVVDVESD